jgi:putative thioredoxin
MQGESEGVETLRQVPGGTPLFARAQALLPLADFFAAADRPADGASAARYRQAAALARSGSYAEAMDELLAIVARDRAFGDDGARKALLGLFAALGDENPLVPPYRRKLANTLF